MQTRGDNPYESPVSAAEVPSSSSARRSELAVSLTLGVLCPGLLAFRGPHIGFVMLAAAVLPVYWIGRWKTAGFLAGTAFLWLSFVAMGLASIGPGQVDNILPGMAVFFGWAPAILYLGPIYLTRMMYARFQSDWRRMTWRPQRSGSLGKGSR